MADTSDIILNFKPSAYQNAIDGLQEQLTALESARAEYVVLRDRISSFWTGQEAEAATENINKNIKLVEQAYANVEEQKKTYMAASDDAGARRENLSSALNELGSALSDLFV